MARTLQEIIALLGRGLLEEMPARDAGKAITDIRRSVEPAKRMPKAGETMVVRSLPKKVAKADKGNAGPSWLRRYKTCTPD